MAACAALALSFEEWAAAAGLLAFVASFLEAGAAGRLCFWVMSFRRARRIAVRHRGVADGVDKVACGKGGAFYANDRGLTKRKSPAAQQLPCEFYPRVNARFGPKGSRDQRFSHRPAAGFRRQPFPCYGPWRW